MAERLQHFEIKNSRARAHCDVMEGSPLCSIDRVAEMAERDLVDGKRADEYRPQ